MKYLCRTRAVGTGASPVEVSMCMREGYIRDDYHMGNYSRPTPCLRLFLNFAHYFLSWHTYGLCFSQYKCSFVGWAI